MTKYLTALLLAVCMNFSSYGQTSSATIQGYGPTDEYPYGRMNPKAPSETLQFDFMIGEFDRSDSLFNQTTGTWSVSSGEWNTNYVMNGYAIQDHSWNKTTQSATTNLRIFDPAKKKWVVSWFKAPNLGTASYEGAQTGNEIVLNSSFNGPNGPVEVQYVFFEITENSYKWRGQAKVNGQWFPFWKISCVRKN